jgi:excisionase family DNA binding protein
MRSGTEQNYLKDKRYAARYLGVSVHKVHRMIQDGSGPRFIKIGPLVRFRPEDLAAFIEANSRGGQSVKVAEHLEVPV